MPIAQLGAHEGLESLGIPADSWTDGYWASPSNVWADWEGWGDRVPVPSYAALRGRIEVPGADALSIDFARTERGSKAPSSDKHYEIIVDSGRYFVEPALLVSFVYKGERTIDLASTPSGTERRVGLQEDWHVAAAAMLDVFPLGRQKGHISSFRDCRSRSCVENWLGAQVGFGLDSTFHDWYAGIVLEPLSGLALNMGAALRQGEFWRRATPRDVSWLSDQLNKYTAYVVRPYFGVTVTLDLLGTLERGASLSSRGLF